MEVDEGVGRPRGTKRKADDAQLPAVQAPRKIKALDQDVVNKIAAGEIIVAPVHALKELIENAVDAGSTSLEILVKDGGLKLLQITDNGSGIDRSDLPILCERFTTSKLKTFEDLSSIGTYGFRGEALASISHIAHLTVTTKTKESNCAWRAHYTDGRLAPAKPGQNAEPKATAGRGGTQITVEDLFYNVPTRRRAFRSASEEYAKILDVVGRYAVHCLGVAFSCKKHGDSAMGISTPSNASTVDRIRQIHGSAVASELVQIKCDNSQLGFTAEGWTSNANHNVKRTTLLLFINHRAVESSAIKKAVEHTYSTFLPKGGHPFTYLSLDIDPQRVDVNVHPTKREVNFLNEDEIIEKICDEIRIGLANVDTSRTFMTQSLLPGVRMPTTPTTPGNVSGTENRRSSVHKPYENNLVRTDSKLRKITSMLPPNDGYTAEGNGLGNFGVDDEEYEYTDREPVNCRLTTVKELRAEVREEMHNELTDVFSGHTFVGVVDERRRIVAIQGGVKLFLVDYGMIWRYFYQVGLTDFGNFGSIRFDPPLNLRSLLEIAVATEKEAADHSAAPLGSSSPFNWDAVVDKVFNQLLDRREMLMEYFSLSLSASGDLLSIPLLMKGYTPSLAKLPAFLLKLGPNVDWTGEKECFASFLRELAAFYVPERLPPQSSPAQVEASERTQADDTNTATEDTEHTSRRKQVHRVIENVMFPAFRARLIATRGLAAGVLEVANLKGLYRVFERC
ncbi:MAG: DNA mismatch repair protein [Sclerophora amabilis]|nr:MAG: DNA mismatch repair protein [Sclerophora amabilis]